MLLIKCATLQHSPPASGVVSRSAGMGPPTNMGLNWLTVRLRSSNATTSDGRSVSHCFLCFHLAAPFMRAQVDWPPGQRRQLIQEEDGNTVESVAADAGSVRTSLGVPDGRFRDGRLLYTNN